MTDDEAIQRVFQLAANICCRATDASKAKRAADVAIAVEDVWPEVIEAYRQNIGVPKGWLSDQPQPSN